MKIGVQWAIDVGLISLVLEVDSILRERSLVFLCQPRSVIEEFTLLLISWVVFSKIFTKSRDFSFF